MLHGLSQTGAPPLCYRRGNKSLREGRSLSKVIASTRMLGVKLKSDLKAHVFPPASLSLECPPLFSRLALPHLSPYVTHPPERPPLPPPVPLTLSQPLAHSIMAHLTIILWSP